MEKEHCHRIEGLYYPVFIGKNPWNDLKAFIAEQFPTSKLFILTDENVNKECLPGLLHHVEFLKDAPVISVPSGEGSKSVETALRCWDWLTDQEATRSDLLINLGGGVVTDLGGYVAATYKRGMPFIHIPTTLIGQADAAIGGKTGINFSGYKNHLGYFANPSTVFIDPGFLETLPKRELISGYAELIKSALISGGDFWTRIREEDLDNPAMLQGFIADSVTYKLSITDHDLYDRDLRKCLNFGHTIGHAMESLSFEEGRKPLLHGEAVAAGMICEAYISAKIKGLDRETIKSIHHLINKYFPQIDMDLCADDLHRFLVQDKKNTEGTIRMTLLRAPGQPRADQPVGPGLISESLVHYKDIFTK
jgi:3-dehydroquinate synthase